MKGRYLILLCSLVSLLLAVNAAAQYSHIKDISGTDHNLSTSGTGTIVSTGEKEICYFCHAPHQSLNTSDSSVTTGPAGQEPLWNHYLSSKATYGVYSSTSFNALGTDITDLGAATAGTAAVSNLCLSCHDGTVGVNTLYHGQFGVGSPAMNGCANGNQPANSPCYMLDGAIVGGTTVTGTASLANLHPINFTYDATLAGKTVDLVTPVANSSGIGGSARMGIPGSVSGTFLPLFQTPGGATFKMQCPTCHDVHSNRNGRPFLRDTTTGSALCLDCHGN